MHDIGCGQPKIVEDQLDPQLIRARTGEGRKARGVHMGRPPKLTPHQKCEALKALADGAATQADLARRFNISQSTISRLAEKAAPLPLAARPALDAETERAARAFMQRLEGKYPAIEGRVARAVFDQTESPRPSLRGEAEAIQSRCADGWIATSLRSSR